MFSTFLIFILFLLTECMYAYFQGLCEIFEIVHCNEGDEDSSSRSSGGSVRNREFPFLVIKEMFISLLGRMGVPDILTLRHSDFPAKLRGSYTYTYIHTHTHTYIHTHTYTNIFIHTFNTFPYIHT